MRGTCLARKGGGEVVRLVKVSIWGPVWPMVRAVNYEFVDNWVPVLREDVFRDPICEFDKIPARCDEGLNLIYFSH